MSDCIHLIAQASGGNGIPGEQSGVELNFDAYYNGASCGGFGHVIRFTSEYAAYADKMASLMEDIILNGHIGYSSGANRKGLLRAMVCLQKDKDYHAWEEAEWPASFIDWPTVDVSKLKPCAVKVETTADCSSSISCAFQIATGSWYHSGVSFDGASVVYSDTRPNRLASQSASFLRYFEPFCSGEWSPIMRMPVLSGYSYPCFSEEKLEKKDDGTAYTVDDYYTGVPAALKGKPCTLHRITFKLGANNSTFSAPANASYGQKDSRGNTISAHIYQYRWVRCMEHLIVADDGKTLLAGQYDENGQFIGYGDSATAVCLCEKWDDNPTVGGFDAHTINAPYGYEGANKATVIANQTGCMYIPIDGYSADTKWDLTDTTKTGVYRGRSAIEYDDSNGTFTKRTNRELRYNSAYESACAAATGTKIRVKEYPSFTALYADSKCVWVKTGGTPDSTDIMFPMWAVQECAVADGHFTYGGVSYAFAASENDSVATVEIVSTGHFYRHWITSIGGGHVYVQTWEGTSNDEDSGVDKETWYEYKNSTFTKLNGSPFDSGGSEEVPEGDIPGDAIVTSVLNVLEKETNLKRGDIICTRKWSEGNTSGGHVVMYV